MNQKFHNSLNRIQNDVPPIWMMRQAGRYHSHYQNMKKTSTFSQLCLNPKLAAEVALGPIQDFDFDVAILFSDILFPLMHMGVDLIFEEFGGPKLQTQMNLSTLQNAPDPLKAAEKIYFQHETMIETRRLLPNDKSLIGFVGGLFTLYTFATQGTHKNGIREAKLHLHQLWNPFAELFTEYLIKNIELQLTGGAEVVMVLDTAAGELSAEEVFRVVVPSLKILAKRFPKKLAYYSKGIASETLFQIHQEIPELAGLGMDHRSPLRPSLEKAQGFLQGNFDPELILLPHEVFKVHLQNWWSSHQFTNAKQMTGWVCGLGHGILPQTPEENVRYFVKWIRSKAKEI